MLLGHPTELLGTGWVLLAGLLVPLLQAAEAAGPLGRKAAAVGSSVLLSGPGNVTRVYAMRWEFLDGASSRAILQYQGGSHHPAIHAPYTSRAIFHPSDGSLLLEDLRESDSGVYKVTVTPGGGESLETLLEVLKPVSRPRLRSRALVAQATGEVLCDVADGKVDTITWKKDGQPLPLDRGFQLSDSLSVLYLRAAKKSDCGSYSCNASNEISWQETSLNVTIAGLSPPLQDALRIAVVAVVFAAVSGWGLIFPVCQSEKLRIRGELWRWLSAYTCGLVCIASVLAGTAGVLWMREEGPSMAIILPEIALTYVMVVTFLVAITVTFQPPKLIQLKSKTARDGLRCSRRGGCGGADDQLPPTEHPPPPRRRMHGAGGCDGPHRQRGGRLGPPAPRHLPLLSHDSGLAEGTRLQLGGQGEGLRGGAAPRQGGSAHPVGVGGAVYRSLSLPPRLTGPQNSRSRWL